MARARGKGKGCGQGKQILHIGSSVGGRINAASSSTPSGTNTSNGTLPVENTGRGVVLTPEISPQNTLIATNVSLGMPMVTPMSISAQIQAPSSIPVMNPNSSSEGNTGIVVHNANAIVVP